MIRIAMSVQKGKRSCWIHDLVIEDGGSIQLEPIPGVKIALSAGVDDRKPPSQEEAKTIGEYLQELHGGSPE